MLLVSTLRDLFPDPVIATRLSFRMISPDVRNARLIPDVPGRYLSKDMGSVVIAPDMNDDEEDQAMEGNDDVDGEQQQQQQQAQAQGDKQQDKDGATDDTSTKTSKAQPPSKPSQQKRNTSINVQGDDADRSLQEFRFVIGDYIDCAIQPPLEDGSVAAPPPPAPRNPPPQAMAGSSYGGNMRAFDRPEALGPGAGMGRGGMYNGGGNGFGRRGGRESAGIPQGEWRRGDRLPEHESPWTRGGGRRGRY